MSADEAIARAEQLLPAWFVPRMMGDVWSFALLTPDGRAMLIDHIDRVRQGADGSIWLDVVMSEPGSGWEDALRQMKLQIITAPTDRTTASINAAHIVAAFEIAST
jgi:hypothetical protein